MTTTTVRAVIEPPPAVRRWAPPAGAVAVAVGLWWLTTTVLSAPHSLLRQAAPQRVAPAVVDLFARGVLLPDIGISNPWHRTSASGPGDTSISTGPATPAAATTH